MSSIIRKLEEAVHPDRHGHKTSTTEANPYTGKDDYATAPIPPLRPPAPVPAGIDAPTGAAHNTSRPHRYDVLNKLDPSVDSRAGAPVVVQEPASAGPLAGASAAAGSGTLPHATEGGHRRQTVPVTGGTLPGPAPHTAGPHRHDLANKLDPSVDSKTGVATSSPHGYSGPGGVAAEQAPTRHHEPLANAGALHGPAPNTAGPHRYDVLNKLDPSVNSGVGSGALAPGQGVPHGAGHTAATGHTAGHTAGQTAGHTTAHTAPGVAAALGGHPGGVYAAANDPAATGLAPNTAGPHRSDLMNELDPRVDAHPDTVHGSTRRGI